MKNLYVKFEGKKKRKFKEKLKKTIINLKLLPKKMSLFVTATLLNFKFCFWKKIFLFLSLFA